MLASKGFKLTLGQGFGGLWVRVGLHKFRSNLGGQASTEDL